MSGAYGRMHDIIGVNVFSALLAGGADVVDQRVESVQRGVETGEGRGGGVEGARRFVEGLFLVGGVLGEGGEGAGGVVDQVTQLRAALSERADRGVTDLG